MTLTDDLKKFLSSPWGQKLVLSAMLMGSEFFVYGKTKWKTRDLKNYVDGLKIEDSKSQNLS